MMRRSMVSATLLGALAVTGTALAGPVGDNFRGGVFGLPWSAGKSAIQAKYPGGKWEADEQGRDRYCAPSRQSLLKLPPQHQTRELCFLIGAVTVIERSARLLSFEEPEISELLKAEMSRRMDLRMETDVLEVKNAEGGCAVRVKDINTGRRQRFLQNG